MQVDDTAVNETAGDAKHDYSGAAFEARLDLQGLPRRGGPWTVVFSLGSADGGVVSAPFAERDQHGSAGFLVPATVDGATIQPEWSETNGLVLRSVSAPGPAPSSPVVATSVEADPVAATLVVRGEASAAAPPSSCAGRASRSSPTSPGRATPSPRRCRCARRTGTATRVRSSAASTGCSPLDGQHDPIEVALTPPCVATLGRWVRGSQFHARVERTRANGVRLRIDPPLRDDERGAFAQMQLRRGYHAMPPGR